MSDEGRLRGVRSWPQRGGDERAELIEAVMAISGEAGFADLNIKLVIERVGTHNRNFHRHFESLEEAFAIGYEELAAQLCEDILGAGRGWPDWRSGFRGALAYFLVWVATEPASARLLLSEYRLAGEDAFAAHERCCERLAAALDSGRSLEHSGRAIPETTPRLLLGAIEFIVSERVRRGEAASVPELEETLAYFAVSVYFGNEIAGEELE